MGQFTYDGKRYKYNGDGRRLTCVQKQQLALQKAPSAKKKKETKKKPTQKKTTQGISIQRVRVTLPRR